jgi:LPXTG-site transpeptidase (sortase) family protein
MTDVVDAPRNRKSGLRARWALLLGAVLILTGIGTVTYQVWPEISYEIGLTRSEYPYPCVFADLAGEKPRTTTLPLGSRLVIPEIGVDAQVLGGNYDEALRLGVYHHTETAEPGSGENIAIAGHRVRRAFTLLHRLSPGDPVVLYWDGVEHDYRVTRTITVGPDDTSILEPTGQEQLTLYTCTPRFLG